MSTTPTTTKTMDKEIPPNMEQTDTEMESSTVAVTDSKEELELTQEQMNERRKACYKKTAIGVILLAFIVFVVVDATTTGYLTDAINSFLEWIEDNPVPGFFAFMIVYFVATVCFVPGSILTLGAGFVFANAFGLGVGVLLGTLSVFFGASTGATAAFLLGRYLFRDWVKGLTKKYAIFEALDIALEEKGLRIMVLLRLSPIIPFNAINYIGGVTAISLVHYVLALLAILPGTVVYVFLGASAGSLADSASSGSSSTVTIIVVVLGAIFGIAAIFLTSYYAKKELNRVIAEREAQQQQQQQQEEEEEAVGDIENQQGSNTD